MKQFWFGFALGVLFCACVAFAAIGSLSLMGIDAARRDMQVKLDEARQLQKSLVDHQQDMWHKLESLDKGDLTSHQP